jgi:serine/threonine protein kinase
VLKELRKIELSAKHAGWNIQNHWEVDAEQISLGIEIGRGSFGVVRVANYRGITIAVKTVDVGASREAKMQAKKLLLSEVKTLSRVEHPNVIQLIGACVNPPMLLMAHASGGTLRSLLDTFDEGNAFPVAR